MADVLRFVDSVSASATTRLDLNDDTAVLHVREVQWNPPRLRRSVSQNMMRDGGHAGPSSYDLRTLVLTFDVIASSVDTLATHLQALTRELDRETNWLMYQPTGATHPVFFKTYRSDIAGFVDVPAAVAFRQLTVEIVTDPHAIGLLETVNVGTVPNDPADSGGNYFDLTSIKGDVTTPLILKDTAANDIWHVLAVRRTGTPSDMTYFVQAEDCTADTDTSNPGGGPDAAMSGSGTNNYLRTTFGTTTALQFRVTWSPSLSIAQQEAMRGRFRLLVVVRPSGGLSTMTLEARYGWNGDVSTAGQVTVSGAARQVVDLGFVEFGQQFQAGYSADALGQSDITIYLKAARSGAVENLDWDGFYLLPADDETAIIQASMNASTDDWIYDGVNQRSFGVATGADPFTTATAQVTSLRHSVSGSFLTVAPGVTNRIFYVRGQSAVGTTLNGALDKTSDGNVTAYYYPLYTTVRPVAT